MRIAHARTIGEPAERRKPPVPAGLLAAAALLGLLWPHASALAATGVTHSLRVEQIHVASNGHDYVSVAPFEWDAEITIDAGELGGTIKSWGFYPVLGVAGQDDLSLRPFAASATYKPGHRPRRFHGNLVREVSHSASATGWSAVEDWARLACRRQANAWRNKGWPDEEIFSENHVIAVRYRDAYEADFTIEYLNDLLVEGSPPRFTEIVCSRTPEVEHLHKKPTVPRPPSNDLAVPFSISGARISFEPSHFSGACPMDLTVTAALDAVGEGTASFRLVHNGAPGPVRKVTFKKGGTKMDSATYEVGAPSGELGFESAGGGSGGGSSGGGPFGGPGQMQAPTSPGQHTGYFAIRVVAPNTVESEEAFYSVICKPQTTVGTPTVLAVPKPPAGDPPSGRKRGNEKPEPKPEPASRPATEPQSKPEPAPAGGGSDTPTRSTKQPAGGGNASAPAIMTVARPDLEVMRASSQGGGLSLLVRNAGAGPAPKSALYLSCAAGGRARTWTAQVPALPAGGQRQIQTRPPARSHIVRSGQRKGCRIEVDPGKAIPEANEGNNTLFCAECSVGQAKKRR